MYIILIKILSNYIGVPLTKLLSFHQIHPQKVLLHQPVKLISQLPAKLIHLLQVSIFPAVLYEHVTCPSTLLYPVFVNARMCITL